ncbi:MAG: tRNA preQ1(34) S-adenosylmethionine ribosyltransferase-isomerase QueA [Omnitrophica WOR_2 bacterium GWA2_47_8]|nr:MAG: tRNA preQ1(34) S-adenosylmethionine ribosyltransferase-isomerase QueA [Omnitrophica WOR_2 bacterium GWA2_47_8]
MKLAEFDYTLSPDLIAQQPLKKRDAARLLVVDRKNQKFYHDTFADLDKYLPPKSLMVVNDSKVIPARLFGKKEETGGAVEIFLLKQLDDKYSYKALLKPLKKFKLNQKIFLTGSKVYAQVTDIPNRVVRFNTKDVDSILETYGRMPLPPYIKRSDTASDRADYQTVYAKKRGSVAAPTAGLHFTEGLLGKLKKAGHAIEEVTLHVNYATFKTVTAPDIREHEMHTEDYEVSQRTAGKLRKAQAEGKKIVAVGTTSCRVLETLAQKLSFVPSKVNSGKQSEILTTSTAVVKKKSIKVKGETDIFIYPGYDFQMTDCLITNFHFPKSTLLMLVYAFGGKDLMRRAYQEAIEKKYRFFSYGDGMLIK